MSKRGKAAVWFSLFVFIGGYAFWWLKFPLNIILPGLGLLFQFVLLIYLILLIIEFFRKDYSKKQTVGVIAIIVFSVFNFWYVPLNFVDGIFREKPAYVGVCEHTAVSSAKLVLYHDGRFRYETLGFFDRVIYKGHYKVNNTEVVLEFYENTPDYARDTLEVITKSNGRKYLKEYAKQKSEKRSLQVFNTVHNKLF